MRKQNVEAEKLYRWFSAAVTVAMLVHRTKEKKVFWEFDAITMQNKDPNLLLFCATTWPSYRVTENHLLHNEGQLSPSKTVTWLGDW